MARLSKEEHDKILSDFSEKANADPEMMNLIERLRADFDESLRVDLSETEREWKEKYDSMKSERDRAIGERDEARRSYRERFFSNSQEEAKKIVKNQKMESPRGMNAILGINTNEEEL